MAFPGNPGGRRHDPTEHASIAYDADKRYQQRSKAPPEECQRGEVTKEAEDQPARANMDRIPGQKPGQATGQNDAAGCDNCKLATSTDDCSQNYKRDGVGRQVSKR